MNNVSLMEAGNSRKGVVIVFFSNFFLLTLFFDTFLIFNFLYVTDFP